MQMGNAWKEDLTFLHTNMGRKLLRPAKLEVNIVKKRWGGGGLCQNMAYTTTHITHAIAWLGVNVDLWFLSLIIFKVVIMKDNSNLASIILIIVNVNHGKHIQQLDGPSWVVGLDLIRWKIRIFYTIQMVRSGKLQVGEEIMCGLGSVALPTYLGCIGEKVDEKPRW
jgi:hypothetical protein